MADRMNMILSRLDMAHTDDSVQLTADCGCPCWIAPIAFEAVYNPFVKTSTICVAHAMSDPETREALAEQGAAYCLPGDPGRDRSGVRARRNGPDGRAYEHHRVGPSDSVT